MLYLDEANRCLSCKNPRCKQHCPISTPIPEVIALYKEGKLKEAGEVLFKNNPLSLVCSIVCPHEDQCRGYCIKGIKDEPVRFHDIETEISTKYLEEMEIENTPKIKDRVAIVGGGPAGITIAFILSQKGYKVTLFDAHEKIGGVLRYGIPEYRLPNKMIDKIEERLLDSGVVIRPNTLIGPVITIDKLFSDGYKAIFIGTGVWNPKTLNIKGETLGNVHYAIDYLKSPNVYRLGKRVAVIGAGNVAMDAARVAKRNGADEVYILYRKGEEDIAPLEITEEGVKLVRTENIKGEDGRVQTKILEDEEEFFECDSTIIAVSQAPKNNIVSHTESLETNKWGLLVTDEQGHTTRDGVFGSGDVVTGAKTVVEAVANAKIVANAIEEYCTKKLVL
ncbi:NAD(P)-dependent oxidoreductase [Clostridium sp.]|uniref:NAD(P)-dependent oxidoreductase n=1 Tax=Clostridium sp. TaxID=1506 RepID=UPI002B25B93F|nr:NAD(P)-dependent oxidoreductase [Clostridium sp.]